MNNQSILVAIQNAVNQITWKTELQCSKASTICKAIFNQYVIDGNKFSDYKTFGNNYFKEILPSKRDIAIKSVLIANNILECDNIYNVNKGISKGYRFNHKFFSESNISSTVTTFTYSTISINSFTKSTISYLSPHGDISIYDSRQAHFLKKYIVNNLNNLAFDNDIDEYISELSKINSQDIVLNHDITDEFIYLTHQKQQYRYSLQKAIEFAQSTNNDVIQYKDKYYVDTPSNFIENKSLQLRISYCQSIFNLKNQLYYCNRNSTNNRLDYNLTGLKKELFSKISFCNEKLIELDIANAQFAIAAHLNPSIDENFLFHAKNGSLYIHIEKELNLNLGEGKALMFRTAFDKVKHNYEFDQVRKLFPKYMHWIDCYKKDYGYKSFSNLLQRKEAEIMIDGLLMLLINKGYSVFPIHDALRVKKSESQTIKSIIEEYFINIGFQCYLRIK